MEKIEDFLKGLDAKLPPVPEGVIHPDNIDPAAPGGDYSVTIEVRKYGANIGYLREALEKAKEQAGYDPVKFDAMVKFLDTWHPRTLFGTLEQAERDRAPKLTLEALRDAWQALERAATRPEPSTLVDRYALAYPAQYERLINMYGEGLAREALQLALTSTLTIQDAVQVLRRERLRDELHTAMVGFADKMRALGEALADGYAAGIAARDALQNRKARRAAKHKKPLDPDKPEQWRKRGRK